MYFYILTLSCPVCINIYLLLQEFTARLIDKTIVPQNESLVALQSHEAFTKSCWNKKRSSSREVVLILT